MCPTTKHKDVCISKLYSYWGFCCYFIKYYYMCMYIVIVMMFFFIFSQLCCSLIVHCTRSGYWLVLLFLISPSIERAVTICTRTLCDLITFITSCAKIPPTIAHTGLSSEKQYLMWYGVLIKTRNQNDVTPLLCKFISD